MPQKVMVTGCYDLLHSGHIAFFKEASAYGDLYVALGSDKTVFELKGRLPLNSEQERLFMVKSVGYVKDAFISQGSGVLDYVDELKALQPDIFVVNGDGHTPDKEQLCRDAGVEYVVLAREPYEGLERRSTTDLRSVIRVPFRIDLAGGWLDQPFVSRHHPGAVVTISIEPTVETGSTSAAAWPPARAMRQSTCGERVCRSATPKSSPRSCFATTTHLARRKYPARRTALASCSRGWPAPVMTAATGRRTSTPCTMKTRCAS